jgi:heat shock protein HslJ
MKTVLLLIAGILLLGAEPVMASKKKVKQTKPEGAYQLIAQLDGGKMVMVGFKNSNILFNNQTQKFNAYVGCNTISGVLNSGKKTLQLGQLTRTEKACPDYIDGLEEQFIKHLEQVNGYRWEGSTLLLLNNETVLMKMKKKLVTP